MARETINSNVVAFLQVISHCEGTAGPDGYRMHFGMSLFSDFSRHPNKAITATLKGRKLTSTAAGKYQFLFRTWDWISKKPPALPDFSPASQDEAAIRLIKYRQAYEDVVAGRFDAAVYKCNKEWASLPGSPYDQPVKTIEYCRHIYELHGGIYEEDYMDPITASILTTVATGLINKIPELATIFGVKDKPTVQAAEVIVGVVSDAVGANNAQEALTMVSTDADKLKAAEQAVSEHHEVLLDFSGVKEARQFSVDVAASNTPAWMLPAMWVSGGLLPLLYYTVHTVLRGAPELGFSGDLKAAVASSVITGILGGLIGFWLGSSYTTSRSRGINATPSRL